MYKERIIKWLVLGLIILASMGCSVPALIRKDANTSLPPAYSTSTDTLNSANTNWRDFFHDPYLAGLIDSALANNQELNITLQEIEVARNEIRARKGEYLPSLSARAGAGVEKMPRYTNIGAMEATTEIKPGKEMPEPLPDLLGGVVASWELDVWHKLRNAKQSAVNRYLASVEGRNFLVTNLISEIAGAYYELLVLDNQLDILQQNIKLQSSALDIVKIQKESARVNELAVRRFQAQVLHTQALQYQIQQKITEKENEINFLVGRLPQPVLRERPSLDDLVPRQIQAGIPVQLLANRPDIRQAEFQLKAARLDVQVARASFYPSLGISSGLGLRAFSPAYLLKPESIFYSLAGDMTAPLVNKNAIKARYFGASAQQVQAVYQYEKTILKAHIEVMNEMARINNLEQSYQLKAKEVEALTQSVAISNKLFSSARADYMEVLMTQRDALESKFDLTETKMQQMNAMVNIYRTLGGGWK
jgi:multidrug efflux system outer membrane protein